MVELIIYCFQHSQDLQGNILKGKIHSKYLMKYLLG